MEDKVIVITGASAGIGAALAELAASRGASVVLAARREKELDDVRQRCGDKAFTVVADMTKREEARGVVAGAEEGLETHAEDGGVAGGDGVADECEGEGGDGEVAELPHDGAGGVLRARHGRGVEGEPGADEQGAQGGEDEEFHSGSRLRGAVRVAGGNLPEGGGEE